MSRPPKVKTKVPLYPEWHWEGKTFREKEEQWIRFYDYRFDETLTTPITTVAEALRVYSAMILMKGKDNHNNKALARRAWLAAKKGGVCEMNRLKEIRPELGGLSSCTTRVEDFRFLRMWEFNHIVPRWKKKGQFVISGNDCSHRAWDSVRNHAMTDTVLLCRDCHFAVTEYDKESDIEFGRLIQQAEDGRR